MKTGSAWKKTRNKRCIGIKKPQRRNMEMLVHNSVWGGVMKTALVWKKNRNKRCIGIEKPL